MRTSDGGPRLGASIGLTVAGLALLLAGLELWERRWAWPIDPGFGAPENDPASAREK